MQMLDVILNIKNAPLNLNDLPKCDKKLALITQFERS